MKHLKTILTLTSVVLVSVVLIFFVEGVTSEVIETENYRLANLAKLEVLPGLTVDDELEYDTSYDFSNSVISGLIYNSGIGYIYTVEFQGYSSIVEYMIGINMDGEISGFKVLTQGESPGYGDTITDEDYRTQFIGLAFESAVDGEIDDVAGLSGAPVTMGAFKVSLKEAIEYHQTTFGGVVLVTPEEREARLLLDAFPLAVRYEDVTADYEASDDISIIYEAYNTGDTLLGYIYYVEAEGAGYTSPSVISLLVGFNLDKEITGFALLDDTETTGKTADMYKDEYGIAFIGDDMEIDDYGIDAIGGSTDTNVRIHEIVKEIADYHIEFILEEGEFVRPQNVVVTNENLLLAFPEGITFTSTYSSYSYDESIGNIYEVFDVSSDLLGYVYYSSIEGNNGDINYVIGIDIDGISNKIKVLYSEETWDGAETYNYNGSAGYFPDTPWLDNFEGVDINDLIANPIDDIAGVSVTTGSMTEGIESIIDYHLANMPLPVIPLPFPDLVDITNENLLLAYPTGTTFTSIYEDYTYNESIGNIYGVYDGSSLLIGYVYYVELVGRDDDIFYILGINTAGITQKIEILYSHETWEAAEIEGDYDGNLGVFPTTAWLTYLENKSILGLTYVISSQKFVYIHT